jgi:hypothetical protein
MISRSPKPFVAGRSNWLKGQTVPVIAQLRRSLPPRFSIQINLRVIAIVRLLRAPLGTMETAY